MKTRVLAAALCCALLLALVPGLSQPVSAESLTHFNIRLDEPVATRTPDFSPVFNTDVSLYSTVTWQENSPGFNMKLNSHDEFRAGLAYKAVIWIRLSDGNSFATDRYGDLAAALTVNGKAISSLKIEERNDQNQITEVTITCEYDPLPGREISSVLITNIPTPVAGNMPIYSFSIGSSSYDFYHTEPVVWWDMTSGEQLDSSDTFIQGHRYQLNIWLHANRDGGFTFKTDSNGDPLVNATLNSWAADSVTTAYEQEGREVIDIRYTFPPCAAAHTCTPKLVPLQKQTCVLPGFKAYYECTCGKCYEDAAGKKLITDLDGYGIIPADGHKEGEWSHNGTHHYKTCTTCKEVIPGTKEAHNPGAAATEEKPQTCTVCGYTLAPAKNHVHKLTEVAAREATCTSVGNIRYYTCSGCDSLFADKQGKQELKDSVFLPMLEHQAADDWSNDDMQHWKVCQLCQQQLPETLAFHEVSGNGCAVCFYEFAPSGETPAATEPTQSEPSESTPSTTEPPVQSNSDWAIYVMIGLICLSAAIVIAVCILKRKDEAK